jgi:hypothetical protein
MILKHHVEFIFGSNLAHQESEYLNWIDIM